MKNLPRHGFKVVVGAGLWLAVVASASASTAAVQDQHQDSGPSAVGHTAGHVAQTFTAGMSGTLDHVSLLTATSQGAQITVQVFGTDAITGAPSGIPLGSSLPRALSISATWNDFTFTSAVHIDSETKYAIVVPIDGTFVTWYASLSTDWYPLRGQLLVTGCRTCTTWQAFGKDFAFKTFVATSTNQAPTVTSPSKVFVNEGAVPTNSGSFSDADADTVHLSASSGTLNYTPASAGTWTWTGTAADEGPGPFVTVTADDGQGNTNFTTFNLTVQGVAPTAIIGGAPSSAAEGSTVTLTGSGWSPSAEDYAAPFDYAWNVTKDGNPYRSGTGAGITIPIDNQGTFVVTLTATDDGGLPSLPVSKTITGLNVKPSAAITNVTYSAPLVQVGQETVTFTGTFSDPGLLDTHDILWEFGDGASSTASFGPSPSGSATFHATHVYGDARSYTVRLTVNDHVDTGQATRTVTIQTPAVAISAISTFVESRPGLNAGQKNSLEAKLRAASASALRGDTGASCNQLNAFLNEVAADSKTGKLSSGDAGTLTSATRATQMSMGCFRPLVEFLGGL